MLFSKIGGVRTRRFQKNAVKSSYALETAVHRDIRNGQGGGGE